MSADAQKLAALIAKAQISDVHLVETTASTRIRAATDAGERPELAIGYSASAIGTPDRDGVFLVRARIETRVAGNSPKEEPLVLIRATFELRYQVPSELSVSRGQLDAFAQKNGVFNAWPYWREFIQSISVRMNLPPIVLPLFRIGDTRPDVERKRKTVRRGKEKAKKS